MTKEKLRGKKHEQMVAQKFGGTRHLGNSGSGREDVETKYFSIECKERKSPSVHKYMEQAERNSPPGKIPIVVVKQFDTRQDTNVVCIRQEVFLNLFKTMLENQENNSVEEE
jgi:hypothetical protein